jgi:hypothetical protein
MMRTVLLGVLMSVLGLLPVHVAGAASFDAGLFDALLRAHVRDGRVDYATLKAHPDTLTTFLQRLDRVDPKGFEAWPENDRKAFWINAYNAITIAGIVRNYPIKPGGALDRLRFPASSIRQISGFWDTEFAPVMGRKITLNEIEHRVLREQFKDPRIHFAIVCASVGCPTLRGEAYVGENLDRQLDEAARSFVNDPAKVRLDENAGRLYLSSIFDWYKDDFVPSASAVGELQAFDTGVIGVLEFVVRLLPVDQGAFIRTNHPKIEYSNYDWSLNDRR